MFLVILSKIILHSNGSDKLFIFLVISLEVDTYKMLIKRVIMPSLPSLLIFLPWNLFSWALYFHTVKPPCFNLSFVLATSCTFFDIQDLSKYFKIHQAPVIKTSLVLYSSIIKIIIIINSLFRTEVLWGTEVRSLRI